MTDKGRHSIEPGQMDEMKVKGLPRTFIGKTTGERTFSGSCLGHCRIFFPWPVVSVRPSSFLSLVSSWRDRAVAERDSLPRTGTGLQRSEPGL